MICKHSSLIEETAIWLVLSYKKTRLLRAIPTVSIFYLTVSLIRSSDEKLGAYF